MLSTSKNTRTRYGLAICLIVLSLLIIGYSLRLYRLADLPPGLFFDEGANAIDALSILDGHYAVFFPRHFGREGLVMYLIAGAVHFLGRTVVAERLPAALASALTPIALLWLGNVLLSTLLKTETRPERRRWQVLLLSTLAALLTATNLTLTIIGRGGLRVNLLPPLLLVATAGLISGVQRKSRWRLLVAGVATGLMPYTYIPARFYPLFLLVLAGSLLWPQRISWATVRSHTQELLLYLGVSLLVALPIVLHFALNPADFFSRSSALLITSLPDTRSNLLWSLLKNSYDHLAALGWKGDPNWRHNFAERPLLKVGEALCFWIGLGWALWRWRSLVPRLLVLLFAVLMIPVVLAFDHPPDTFRMVPLMPLVFLLTSLGLWQAIGWLLRRLRRSGDLWRTQMTLFALLGGLQVGANLRDTWQVYYQQWANEPEVYQIYNSEWTDLANVTNAIPPASGIVYMVPIGNQYDANFRMYNFDYLSNHTTPVNLFYANADEIATTMQRQLRQENQQTPIREVRLIHWTNGLHWSGDATQRFLLLLNKYGQYTGVEGQKLYNVYHFKNVDLQPTWQLSDHLEPVTVAYDGNLALRGAALGEHGGQQLTLRQAEVDRTQLPLWLVLKWQATDRPKADYALSLRLRNSQGEQVWQQDEPLLSFDGWPSSRWQAGEASESMLTLNLPADLPAGEYHLSLIVYDRATLNPTVQTGVWQPEVTLGTIRVR